MGLTLQGVGALAGGAADSYLDKKADNRQQRESDQKQQQYDQTQAANATEADRVRRIAEIESYKQVSTISNQHRAQIDEKWGGGAGASPRGVGGATATGLGGGIGAMPVVPPAFAEGGLGRVDPTQQPQQALPTEPQQAPQQAPQAQALPTQPEQPEYKTRRQEYQAWYKDAAAKHAMAGGLEGLKAFQDQESALSRKQMLGYGTKGVGAMRDGNAGDAVRHLNTMLDVSPEDSRMRWEAHDGKVHLVGSDDNRGKPYNQEQVMALIENKIKTPESYLQFQAEARAQGIADESVRASKEDEDLARRTQTESERKNEEDEKQARRAQTETERGALEDEKVARQNADAATASALAKLITSKASREKAYAALRDAEQNNWSNENALTIVTKSHDFALKNYETLTEDIHDYYTDHPIAWNDFKSDLAAIQLGNQYDEASGTGLVDPDLAGVISQLIRQPGGGFNLDEIDPDFTVDTHPEAPGQLFAVYKGKYVRLPEMMHADARKHFDIQEGGGKESNEPPPDDPAAEAGLPTEASGPPSPAPPGSPELAPEDAAAGYRYLQMGNGQWQLTNQAGDPVQTNVPPAPPPANFPGRDDAYIMGQRRG